jgi:hypothetical protein
VRDINDRSKKPPTWWRRWWPLLVGLAGVVVLSCIVVAIFVLPAWIVSQESPRGVLPGDRLKAIDDARGALW